MTFRWGREWSVPSQSSAPPARARPPVILVAEDEGLFRELLVGELEEAGYHVLSVASADDAIRMLAGQPVDIVCSDVQMPGTMNGIGLARWLRQFHPRIKTVLFSGDSTAYTDDFGPFLRKPFLPTELAEAVRQLLSAKSS